jgi:hypothetical protein
VCASIQVKAVENLLMVGEFPVDGATFRFFFRRALPESSRTRIGLVLSRSASLDRCASKRRMTALPTTGRRISGKLVTSAVHRYEESIAGRPYLIEVAAVSQDRWRAQIVRIPGVPTALMPFYGATPREAARSLCDWLTRAYARASAPAGPTGSV